jgi:pimeloyl-ACP methyl ester carboxylesterase
MTPVIKTVALATNVRLTYAEHGDSGGIPVVLLHGFTDSWRSVERLLPHLIVYERTGHALHWEQPERFAADLMAYLHQAT